MALVIIRMCDCLISSTDTLCSTEMITSQCLYWLEFTIGIINRVINVNVVHKVQTLVCKYGTACYTKTCLLTCRRLCVRKAFRSGVGTKTCEQRCVEVWGIAEDGGAA